MFDRYELRARLLPALIAVWPLLLVAVVCFPSLRDLASTAVLGGMLACLAPLLAEMARAHGKPLDEGVRRACEGGRLLLHADTGLSDRVKIEARAEITRRVGLRLPLASEELEDEAKALSACSDAVSLLVPSFRKTADHPLVHAELTTFGFRRNLVGLKYVAVASSCIGACAAALLAFYAPSGTAPSAVSAVAGTLCAGAAVLFVRTLTLKWVCQADREYVRQMLLAIIEERRSAEKGAVPEAVTFQPAGPLSVFEGPASSGSSLQKHG